MSERSALQDARTYAALSRVLDMHFPEPHMPDPKTMRAIALDALLTNQPLAVVCGGAQMDLKPKISAALRKALIGELQTEIALEALEKKAE